MGKATLGRHYIDAASPLGLSTNHTHLANKRHHNSNNNGRTNNKNIFLVVPYTRGLSKSFKNTHNNLEIEVHFKGSNTIHTLLVAPKYKDTTIQKIGVIYQCKCT